MTDAPEDPTGIGWNCPQCGSGVANCQGIRSCLDCAWTGRTGRP